MLFNTIAVTLLAMVAIPIVIAICLRSPHLIALPMIAVLFIFSSSNWGQLRVENTIYARGVGELYFSLLNVLLFVMGFSVLLKKLATTHTARLAPQLSPYLIGFFALLIAHIIVGSLSDVAFFDIVGNKGILNVLNMLIFMYFLIMAFQSEKNQKNMMAAIILLAGSRAIFGLVRYFFFDGDSANPYRNFEGLDMKLVFFDIGDNFIACMAAFWAAWWLTSPTQKMSKINRISLYLFMGLEIASVALSFRRSSLLGLALMFILLLYRLPGKQRGQFLLLAALVLSATAVLFFQERLQFASKGDGNFISALIYDISPKKDIESENRFYELLAAARSVGNHWLTGLGTWGTFTGDQEILSYHMGKLDFIHSGFGHLVFKTGLIGLLLFCGVLVQFTKHYFKRYHALLTRERLLADLGFAGFLFWLPTLLIGTPMIEFRSMLLIGMTLALPFIASSAITNGRSQAQVKPLNPHTNHYANT